MEKTELTDAQIEWLRAGLKRTYTERFRFATLLYKNHMAAVNNATTAYKPFLNKYFSDIKNIAS